MARGRWIAVLAAADAWATRSAEAHLVDTDLGPFYNGLAHPVTALEHLLPILALGLLAGQQGPATARRVLVAFPLSLAAGASLLFRATWPGIPAANLLSLLVLGSLVAFPRRLPAPLTETLAVGFGLTHGAANGTAAAAGDLGPGLFLAGLVTTGVVLTTLVPALVVALRPAWCRVAVRVGGSWIAAVGLLMAAFALRAGRPG